MRLYNNFFFGFTLKTQNKVMDYAQNGDEEQNTEIFDIRRLKRPLLEVDKEVIQLEEERPKRLKLKPRLKPRLKLSFKKKTTTKQQQHRDHVDLETSTDPKVDPVITEKDDEEEKYIFVPKPKGKRDDNYHEFGECINGYKFVKPKGSLISVETTLRHSVFTDDSYMLSYEPIKIVEGIDPYSVSQFTKQKEQTYEEYVEKWKLIDVDGVVVEGLPWPNSANSFDKLSVQLLKEFLKEDKRNWKVERIRWHPDNLSSKMGLKDDPEAVAKITKVFQMINDIWEREMK